ncbi:MAG: 16S rRNA (uracil(1498)-N(3))-methyltransferase [Deltaproteobacteria bacterium]|nr:16S rRNA (uracil(1498)-N(3))-methyltransferase [Deltaproteobacteria bacterium]
MRRFFVEKIPATEGLVTISGREARHITRVLRMGPGDHFVLLDQRGLRYQVVIQSVRQGNVMVLLERPLPAPSTSPVDMFIGQALLKSSAMDVMIQKTTELGVNSIHPFLSQRTVVRPRADKRGNRVKRWQDIAIAASKQSDRTRPPHIMPVVSFAELLQTPFPKQTLKIILWEEEQSRDLKSLLRSTLVQAKAVLALVGPEGGFSRQEISLAQEAGFLSVSLGPHILRAETAAIAVAVILGYESINPEGEETAT